MDVRLYEKIYGLRFFILFGLFLAIGSFIFFMISGSAMFEMFGRSEVTSTQPVTTSVAANPTLLNPTSEPVVSPTATSDSQVVVTPVTDESSDNSVTEITPSPTIVATPESTESTENLIVCTGIQSGWLNFRSAPSKSGPIIGYLPDGKNVVFLEQVNTYYPWYRINVDGVDGYAYGEYICKP